MALRKVDEEKWGCCRAVRNVWIIHLGCSGLVLVEPRLVSEELPTQSEDSSAPSPGLKEVEEPS
jgi:hypothetical protein